jgi:hypothetical protein
MGGLSLVETILPNVSGMLTNLFELDASKIIVHED